MTEGLYGDPYTFAARLLADPTQFVIGPYYSAFAAIGYDSTAADEQLYDRFYPLATSGLVSRFPYGLDVLPD